MIIHQPEILIKDEYAILWTKLETIRPIENFPEYLWYRVPEKYASLLSTQSDAFLVAGLLAGMYYGEEIHVRGTVSPRLAYRLDEYQYLLNFRMPEILQPIEIQFSHLAPIEGNPLGVGSAFSGGVDSLYTIWKHLPENQPNTEYQITHGIFIRGFDILHSEVNIYRQLFSQYQKMFIEIGIDLIEMDTNMISIIHPLKKYAGAYGSSLISTGLALAGKFKKYFISSSEDYHILQDFILQDDSLDSDPLADGFLSTDTMEIIHYGSMSRRIEKIEEISNWDIAQEILWVCQQTKIKESTWNCSRCEKCMRSMTPLYALGVLDKFTKFEKPFKNDWEILRYARKYNKWSRFYFVNDLVPYLKQNKRNLLPWIFITFILGSLRNWIVQNLPNGIKLWLRKYGYFYPKDEAPDSYEIHEINNSIEKIT